MGDYISVTDTAKMVRADLKKAFPGTTFSVRSHKYAGGSSIHVDWTAGPTEKQVEGVAAKYHGADFDPMIDLKSRTGAPYANDYIFFQRELPDDIMNATIANLRREYGLGSEYMDGGTFLPEETRSLLRATYHHDIINLNEAARAHLRNIDLTGGYKPMVHAPKAGVAPAEVAPEAHPEPVVPAAGRQVYLDRMKKRLAAYERAPRLSR